MGCTAQLLDDVRSQLAPDDAALKEARERRDLVRRAAESFLGGRRSFASGSLAHGTANCPIHERDKGLDADSGVVLDRNYHPGLGPDSALRGGPVQVVPDVCAHVSRKVLAKYPKATFDITKRAILVSFHEPLPSGEDPPWTSWSAWTGAVHPASGFPTLRPTAGTPRTRRSTPRS